MTLPQLSSSFRSRRVLRSVLALNLVVAIGCGGGDGPGPAPGPSCGGEDGAIEVAADQSVLDACIQPDPSNTTQCDVDVAFELSVEGCGRSGTLSNAFSLVNVPCDEASEGLQEAFMSTVGDRLPTGGPYMVEGDVGLTCFNDMLNAFATPDRFELDGTQTITISVE